MSFKHQIRFYWFYWFGFYGIATNNHKVQERYAHL